MCGLNRDVFCGMNHSLVSVSSIHGNQTWKDLNRVIMNL